MGLFQELGYDIMVVEWNTGIYRFNVDILFPTYSNFLL